MLEYGTVHGRFSLSDHLSRFVNLVPSKKALVHCEDFYSGSVQIMLKEPHSARNRTTPCSREDNCINISGSRHGLCPHRATTIRKWVTATHKTAGIYVKLRDDVTVVLFGIFLCLWSLPGAVTGQSYSVDTADGNNTTPLSVNISIAPTQCPEVDCSEHGRMAGAVIASLLTGILIGVVVTYFTLRCLKKKKGFLPPKDYDQSQTTHFDVNRNNDDATYITDVRVMSSDPPSVKGHKKLERLVKPSQPPSGDVSIPTAATPLIHTTDTSPPPVLPKTTIATPTTTSNTTSGDRETNGDAGNIYSNTGEESLLTQPYEALDIIPEDVEYENTPANNYEIFNMDPPKKV